MFFLFSCIVVSQLNFHEAKCQKKIGYLKFIDLILLKRKFLKIKRNNFENFLRKKITNLAFLH